MEPRDVETNPFASLSIWRSKLQEDLSSEPDRGPDYRLRLLLEQGKDVEIAVQGCLKDSLVELAEGLHWGLLDEDFAEQARQNLYNRAAQELNNDKQLCLQLAREHDLQEAYAREVKRSINRTVSDYERLGDLKFSLLVWRANLLRDTSLAGAGEEVEAALREGYHDALRLIRHCTTKSVRFWSVQHAAGDVASSLEANKQRVYQAAVQLVQRRLVSIGEQRGVAQGTLDGWFAEVSDPEAVPLPEEYGDTPERPGREGVYEPPGDAGKERRISGESEASADTAAEAEGFT